VDIGKDAFMITAQDTKHSLPSIVLLAVAFSAAALLLMIFASVAQIYMEGWEQTAYPASIVLAGVMIVGVFLLWRDSWLGGLLCVLAALGILYLFNIFNPEAQTRSFVEAALILNVITGIGIAATGLATALNVRRLSLLPRQPLLPWSNQPDKRPNLALIAYGVLSILLLLIVSTAQFRPVHNLIDRPTHGQDIRLSDILLSGLVLFNLVSLLALLLGQKWAVYAIALLLIFDAGFALVSGSASLPFLVLRGVALVLLYWIYTSNEAYFEAS
jgi:hypothetical protein